MSRLLNKVAVVTASTEGIGFAIAKQLCEDGAKVAVSSRKESNVNNALKKLEKFVDGGTCIGVPCHVGKTSDRVSLIDKTVQQFGKIDILVSNAAVNPTFGPLLNTDENSFEKMLDINIKSAFMLVKEVFLHMNNGGAICFVSSIAGFHPLPLIGAYSVTKTALLGLTKALASELAPSIRVNCIAPGIIDTKFSTALTTNELVSSQALSQIPIGRFGQPEDCAPLVSFLCSDEARYITGETVIVSGGMPSRL
ncbi:hypothetical protein BOX15_Mlig007263g1 [Macrostomum lignano]|uniref:Dehydrogenase/reductase SDR family member 4 n=2 Tax=Macrostomum lignano TaxID=282301 RepID=A0A1I8J848_9PLAT|nr:hypothetical protein BOX15_Mlig007263g1 [Macrostomum lignano]